MISVIVSVIINLVCTSRTKMEKPITDALYLTVVPGVKVSPSWGRVGSLR